MVRVKTHLLAKSRMLRVAICFCILLKIRILLSRSHFCWNCSHSRITLGFITIHVGKCINRRSSDFVILFWMCHLLILDQTRSNWSPIIQFLGGLCRLFLWKWNLYFSYSLNLRHWTKYHVVISYAYVVCYLEYGSITQRRI